MIPIPGLKYSKVELLLKTQDENSFGTIKIGFEDCFVDFVSHYLVINTKTETGQTGRLFDLKEIHSYNIIKTNKTQKNDS
jgi:hypothetical protein